MVDEGTQVSRGASLFVISSDRTNSLMEQRSKHTRAALVAQRLSVGQELQNRLLLNQKELQSVREAIAANEAEQQKSKEIVEAERRRLGVYQDRLKLYRNLEEAGYVGNLMRLQREEEFFGQEIIVKSRLQELSRLERDEAALKVKEQQTSIQRDIDVAPLLRRQEEVDQELFENDLVAETVITSPVAGTIEGVAGSVGMLVSPSQVLSYVVPADEPLEVAFEAPSRAIGLIGTGMPVTLRFDAFPYQKYGTLTGTVRLVSNVGSGDSAFRVRVSFNRRNISFNGRQLNIRAGMKVQGSIVMEKRRLYEWILAPLDRTQWANSPKTAN